MHDNLHIDIASTEQIGNQLRQDAQNFEHLVQRLRHIIDALQSSGLRGSFVEALNTRCILMLSTLQKTAQESDATGQKLLTIARWARELQIDATLRFSHNASTSHLVNGALSYAAVARLGSVLGTQATVSTYGSPTAITNRIRQLEATKTRLSQSLERLRLELSNLDKLQQDSGFIGNRLVEFGARRTYSGIRNDLQESIARTEETIRTIGSQQQLLRTERGDAPLTLDDLPPGTVRRESEFSSQSVIPGQNYRTNCVEFVYQSRPDLRLTRTGGTAKNWITNDNVAHLREPLTKQIHDSIEQIQDSGRLDLRDSGLSSGHVVVWGANQGSGTPAAGHVAVIHEVHADYVVLSEGNWKGNVSHNRRLHADELSELTFLELDEEPVGR